MNDVSIFISAALLLFAAALTPKSSRTKLFNLFGGSVDGKKQSSDKAQASIIKPAPQPVKRISFPKDRALTENEMYSLANYISDTYKIRATAITHLVTYAYVESSFRPWVTRKESRGRKSVGLMQTLIGTARDMYNKGYTAVGVPTEESLKDPIISMYFGAAYLEWLKKNYRQWGFGYGNYEEFFIRAYNGGAGWRNSKGGRDGTLKYYNKFKKAEAKVGWRNAIF